MHLGSRSLWVELVSQDLRCEATGGDEGREAASGSL